MTLKVAAHQGLLSAAKFGGQRHSGMGDIMVFVYHVALQDNVIKALNNFMVRNPSRSLANLPSLVAMSTMVVQI